MEPSKNFATKICDGNEFTVNRLSNLIIHNCFPKIMKQMIVTEEEVTTILLPCLRLLVGAGEPYKMVYANDLRTSFTAIRVSLMKNGFFRRIRTVLIAKSEHFVDQTEGEEAIYSIKRPLPACSGDQLLSICMFAAVAERSDQTVGLTRDRISLLTTEILTVPMVTLLLSEDGKLCIWNCNVKLRIMIITPIVAINSKKLHNTHIHIHMHTLIHTLTYYQYQYQYLGIRTLARWESMGQALQCISALPPLPPSPRVVFQSEQWLSGNLASLCPYFNVLDASSISHSPQKINSSSEKGIGSPKNKEVDWMSDDALESYLLLMIFFYCNYDVPGVIQGKKGIMWRKEVRAYVLLKCV